MLSKPFPTGLISSLPSSHRNGAGAVPIPQAPSDVDEQACAELVSLLPTVVEVATDREGSRKLQVLLDHVSPVERALLYAEVLPMAHSLMQHVFGNHVMQVCVQCFSTTFSGSLFPVTKQDHLINFSFSSPSLVSKRRGQREARDLINVPLWRCWHFQLPVCFLCTPSSLGVQPQKKSKKGCLVVLRICDESLILDDTCFCCAFLLSGRATGLPVSIFFSIACRDTLSHKSFSRPFYVAVTRLCNGLVFRASLLYGFDL